MRNSTERIATALLLFLSCSLANTGEAADRPNIVLIVADDLGWADVSYHNAQRAETPNIDRLIAGGAELDNFYVAPMCSPTRAGLMTGRYPIRYGLARAVIPPQRDFGLDVTELTLPEALSHYGYDHRGVFGKWHLGHHRPEWHPLEQGFTQFHGHYNGAIDYFRLERDNVRDWHVNWEPSDEQGYSTTLIADAACDWITNAAQDDSPYFCYVPFNAPHSPFQALDEDLQRYARIRKRIAGDQPTSTVKRNGKKQSLADKRQAIAAMIWRMDIGIGQLLDAIDATGEADNTIVWFTSDNGGINSFVNGNKPLRGAKLDVFEGGIRVAAGVKWPRVIPAGVKRTGVTGYVDVLPTLLEAAGADIKAGDLSSWGGKPLDGVNLLGYLAGDSHQLMPRDWYSYHGQQGPDNEKIAVRSEGWKLVVLGPQLTSAGRTDAHDVHLFAINDDPYETTNIATKHPDVVARLTEKLIAYRALQPAESVPPYGVKNPGFTPPPKWRLSAN